MSSLPAPTSTSTSFFSKTKTKHIKSLFSSLYLTNKTKNPIFISQTILKLKPCVSFTLKASSSSPGLYSSEQFELNSKNVDMVLEDVRPYLISDGGNVDVFSVEDGVVSLKLQGLYSSEQFELNTKNVDMVLEDVRPYLISDGGNVDVCSVEDGVVFLKLQGACESCPSSTTTMKMGIERVLKEKFGDAIKEIRQVYDEQPSVTTVEAVNKHLDILRPAIKNYGGSVDVISIDGGDCLVKYVGLESIGSGVKAAIKEKFPDIKNVVFAE